MGISRGQVCIELLLPHIPGIRAWAPCLQSASSFWLVFGSALFPVAKCHVKVFCRGDFQHGKYLLIFPESVWQGWGPVSEVEQAEHPDKWKKPQPQSGKRRERQAGIS